MIGHLEVALRSERTAEEYLRVIQVAHRRAVALGQIVESLLFLSRAGSSLLARSGPLELRGWLTEHMGSRAEDPRSGDVRIEVLAAAPLWVNAQPQLLGQLVENLLENACKYSAPGSPIVVALHARRRVPRCSRSRTRVAGSRRRICRGSSNRSSARPGPRETGPPGVGLGLSVVERVATAFGGTVTVQSVVGRGSRFVVSLPLTADPVPVERRQRPTRPPIVRRRFRSAREPASGAESREKYSLVLASCPRSGRPCGRLSSGTASRSAETKGTFRECDFIL